MNPKEKLDTVAETARMLGYTVTVEFVVTVSEPYAVVTMATGSHTVRAVLDYHTCTVVPLTAVQA